ncbi:MAG: transcriptional regulator, MarR family [Hyphomicrobiales bacterium]|nr:transcriptional regulator, MarR family [Hyphomicrobiales bacterium]
MAPVAALLAMDRTTLTAALKPLERRGLVQIAVDPADSRGRLLSLTEKGHCVLLEAVPIWTRTHATLESDLADPHATREDLAVLSRRDDRGLEQPGTVRQSVPLKRPSSARARKEGQ